MLELRDVVGFEGLYKVSPKGDIWSIRNKKFLKAAGGKGNYQMVLLQVNGKKTYDYIHRIVAKAYIPNPNNWPEVNHIDEVKDNNWYTNLEWCTKEYNLAYGNRSGKCSLKVRCIETDEVFSSLHAAGKAKKVDPTNLSSLLRHGKPHHTLGGYHWECVS